MKSLSPSIYNSLKSVLDYKEDDLESALCFSFVIEREFYGTKQEIELKPNGSSIMVNQQNKHEFVELYVDYIFNKSCEKQFKAFSTGFRRVINSKPLELFFPDELMSFVVSVEVYRTEDERKIRFSICFRLEILLMIGMNFKRKPNTKENIMLIIR